MTRTVPLQAGSEALGLFCTLLGKLVTAGETFLKPLSRQQALDSRDALARHMYGQVFSRMVMRANRAPRSLKGHHTSIGILDIYGYKSSPLLGCLEEPCPGPTPAGTQPCLSPQWGQLGGCLRWPCLGGASGWSLLPTGLRCLSSTALSSSASTTLIRSSSSSLTWWVLPRCVPGCVPLL